MALADMFNYSHVRGVLWDGPWLRPWQWRLVGRWWDPRLLVLVCYFPFGVALILLRLPLLLLFGACTPRCRASLTAAASLSRSRVLFDLQRCC